MAAFLIIIILICIIFLQYKSKTLLTSNIKYIHKKLSNIMENETSERLMIVTDNEDIITLLEKINDILDRNQMNLAKYTKTEISMRKMLSNISHDLKTPLTVVLGYIETMRYDSSISMEEREKLLSRVQDKALEVLELINKFFDLAKLESGDKEIHLTRVNMNEVCKRNILGFYDILTSKNFEVLLDIPEDNIYAIGNVEALDRIINNLISNAIRYGSDGKILGLSLRYDENYTYVDIWDRGKGIDEFNQDRVFERMYTLEDSRNRKYQGSGLGLTITKRLVEGMVGEISFISKPFEKTVFSVKLKRIIY